MGTQGAYEKMYDGLQALDRFVTGTQDLEKDVCYLGEFLENILPLCKLSLIRLNADLSIEELVVWREGKIEESGKCKLLFEELFPMIRKGKQQLEKIENSVLEELMKSTAYGDEVDCHPACFPIRNEGKLVGAAFYGKNWEAGSWETGEIRLLETVTSIIGMSFGNRRLNKEYALQCWVFNEVMDNMRSYIYVTDIETDEILFMNKTMKRAYGLEHPEGKTCWQVLQKGISGRCEFCPVNVLQKEKRPFYMWEENSTLTGHIYENYDSLIRWTDGRIVHFQQSMDMTESKQLAKAANIDELTGILNRRAGKKELMETLHRVREDGYSVVVCMFDVNELKTVNDNFGHGEGDWYIKTIVLEMQKKMELGDYIFRLSGDEFIAVFLGQGEECVANKIKRVQKALAELGSREKKEYDLGFCAGVIQVTAEDVLSVNDILTFADERMYEQKRRLHVKRAEKRKKNTKNQDGAGFIYDVERLYDALMQSTDDYIYICNMKTGVFRYSKSMVWDFDLPCEVIENAAVVWGEKVHPNDKAAFMESNQEITDGRTDTHCVEYRAKNRWGEWVWLRCRGHVERDELGEPSLFAGIIANLGKRNTIDHMTGLFNKFEFESEVTRYLEANPDRPMALVLLGVDEFKHVNNLYNREFGDEVLRIISQKIQALIPPGASVYRLDGDEFGVVFQGCSKKTVETFFKGVQTAFGHQQVHEGKKYFCTLSGGCVFAPRDGGAYLDLLKYAAYSLEYAKMKGKNRLFFFSPEILSHKERALELTELLRESVENGFEGFQLFYQPIVRAQDGTLRGAEALARWGCEKYGPVSPVEFIPLLEESGLIVSVGRWIFREAVKNCSRWAELTEDFTVSINLSYLQLEDPVFLSFMKDTVKKTELNGLKIVVELTESYIASNMELLSANFERIRKLGIPIAMDDFGTGYSSLGILKQSPADVVKIDRTFVRDIRNSTFDLTFIKFVVELCHSVDIQVCLEGVETQEEYEIVRAMNLDMIQGFFFGKPVCAPEFEAMYIALKNGLSD